MLELSNAFFFCNYLVFKLNTINNFRFRDTFLVNGSSLKTNEMFRRFRGRNPSFDPFLKSYLSNK